MKVHKKRLYRIIKEELNRAIRESKWPRGEIAVDPSASHETRYGQYPPEDEDPGRHDDPDLSHLGGEESDSWFNLIAFNNLSDYIKNNSARYPVIENPDKSSDSSMLTPAASRQLVRDWFNATSRSPDPQNPMVSLVEKAKTIKNFETDRPPVGERPWHYYFGNTITYIQENGLSSDNWEESWTQKYDSGEAHQTGGNTDSGDPFGWRKIIKEEYNMKITKSNLRKIIKEEIGHVVRESNGNGDSPDWTTLPALNSWIKYITRNPGIRQILEVAWDRLIAGVDPNRVASDALASVSSEDYPVAATIKSGIKYHGRRINPDFNYPSSAEIRQFNDQKVEDAKKAREEEIIRTTTAVYDENGDILGRVKSASVNAIGEMISKASAASRGKYYADTHAMWRPRLKNPDLTPGGAYKELLRMRQGLPGGVTIYIDPETEEVFGYAKYNTF